jgi:iron complex transport system permease protein
MSRVAAIWGSVWLILAALHMRFGIVESAWSDAFSGGDRAELASTIIWQLRGVRVLLSSSAGAGLALAGLLLQTWFHNPLAGPSVLGISSGATLGVALSVLGGAAILGASGVALGALLGSGFVLAVLWAVSQRYGHPVTLLVFGLMLGYVVGAMVTVLQVEASQEALQAFVFWGMGSFSRATWWWAVFLGVLALGAGGWAWAQKRSLDAWTLGALTASSMGVSERQLRTGIVIWTGVLTAIATAACGPIAFLGVATPHLVRMFQKGRSHRAMIPVVMIAGAILALLADGVVRWSGGSWPLNAVLSILAGPLLVYVLLRKTWAP